MELLARYFGCAVVALLSGLAAAWLVDRLFWTGSIPVSATSFLVAYLAPALVGIPVAFVVGLVLARRV